MKSFKSLTEREVLALAIWQEEEDAKIYADFVEGLRENYPATSKIFDQMKDTEISHRDMLMEMHKRRFGPHIPLVRKQDIKGFVKRNPLWLVSPMSLHAVRKEAESMEYETRRFYETAARRTTDIDTRKLFLDLAEAEREHEITAQEAREEAETPTVIHQEEETRRRLFLLQVVQPGLAGLMDGSVSTLAPLFAAAFATQSTHDALLVGLAASVGAGISMGFAEALSDDGTLTGRGQPLVRGLVCGIMTMAGGLGHTLPYLIPDFQIATISAVAIVFVELAVISWIRYKYMDTPFLSAAAQVFLGGLLVFVAGIIIGVS